jgi:hypothetical protein
MIQSQENIMGKLKSSPKIMIIIGSCFLVYAYLGNYIALPGYLRFLERGRTSTAGNSFDISVLIGTIKTVIWLFSFQLGIFFITLGALLHVSVNRKYISYFICGAIVWLGIAGIPSIPGPYRIFYAGSGFIMLLLILSLIILWTKINKETIFSTFAYFTIIGYIFFALISWDVCGLGTMGRILDMETAYKSGTGPMIITQMTKIMFEFIFAWGFTVLGHYLEHKNEKV